ncbi:MAG: Gfo/Idh/MocA family oxidoreductase [Armatimonadetes bacterium]|nr:Gfo/Idh/MocA family oxidoreductase [Armatimonadota bacterium]
MKTFGVGMVGYGFMGKVHTYAYQSLPMIYDPPPAKIRLVGVATATEASGKKAIEQAGYEFATRDYHELLRRDDVHIINVCVPNHLHRDVAIDALNAGKHVYCDKPLAANLDQARDIWNVARQAKTIHQMTFNYRFIPALLRAKQLVDAGFLGRVFQFRVCYLHSSYIDPDRPMSWRTDKEKGGGGASADLGSHVIDLVRHLLGEFESVFATTETFIKERPVSAGASERMPVEVDDVCWMQARLESGAIGAREASRMSTGACDEIRIEIHGEMGAIRFNSMDPNWLDAYDVRLPAGDYGGERGFKRIECVHQYPKPAALPGPKNSVGWMTYHIASMYDFVENVARCRQSSPSIYDGLKVQEILEAAYESSRTDNWITISALQGG